MQKLSAYFVLLIATLMEIEPHCLESICRAEHTVAAAVYNISVYHCRTHVFVTQKLLNCPNVITIFV